MNAEKFPIIDPLQTGHTKADKILEQREKEALEKEVDRYAEEERLAKEERQKDLDELYGDKDVMGDIFPSWDK